MDHPLQPFQPADIAKNLHLDHETLHQQLKLFIFDLLEHDFERLCALMYRHDVHESKFNEALGLPNDQERAAAIAHLVIDREILKRNTRAAYSREKNKNAIKE